jgi:FixJ family two-component response regulator
MLGSDARLSSPSLFQSSVDMAQVLLIDSDQSTLRQFEHVLSTAGHMILTATSGLDGLELLRRHAVDLILSNLYLPDISGLELLRLVRDGAAAIPFVAITTFGNARGAVAAMKLGAAEFIEKPVREDSLLRIVEGALVERHEERSADVEESTPELQTAHAAERWARAVVPIVDAAVDPRTVRGWSRLVYVSPGALRNWCRMAGIPPRRSLVFARLLRVVCLSRGGRHKPENLLDVVDRRTLVGLLRFAGLSGQREFPEDVDTFLEWQQLVRDPDALRAITSALAERRACERRTVNGRSHAGAMK